MAQSQYPKPHKPNAGAQGGGGSNVLQALILHQHQTAVSEAQKQLKELQQQTEAHKAELEQVRKKKEMDDKLHEETRKELDKYKSQYDANHILEKKAVQKDTMTRARLQKKTTKKQVTNAQKAKSRLSSKRAPKKST